MKTPYVDPLIPLQETGDETLTRLSANIGTLTDLMNDSGRTGLYARAAMFERARDTKAAEAEGIIALATGSSDDASADDRRFLLVRGTAPATGVPVLPRQRSKRSTSLLALTQ